MTTTPPAPSGDDARPDALAALVEAVEQVLEAARHIHRWGDQDGTAMTANLKTTVDAVGLDNLLDALAHLARVQAKQKE